MLYDEETDTFLGCGRLRDQQPAQRLINGCCVPTVGFDWVLIFPFFWFLCGENFSSVILYVHLCFSSFQATRIKVVQKELAGMVPATALGISCFHCLEAGCKRLGSDIRTVALDNGATLNRQYLNTLCKSVTK